VYYTYADLGPILSPKLYIIRDKRLDMSMNFVVCITMSITNTQSLPKSIKIYKDGKYCYDVDGIDFEVRTNVFSAPVSKGALFISSGRLVMMDSAPSHVPFDIQVKYETAGHQITLEDVTVYSTSTDWYQDGTWYYFRSDAGRPGFHGNSPPFNNTEGNGFEL